MKFGLREKISLTIIVISMAVTSVLSVIFYTRSVNTIEQNYTASVTSSLRVCADTFDDVMRDAYYACIYAANDDIVLQQMQAVSADAYQQLMETLDTYRGKNNTLDSIYCYLERQDVLLKVSASGMQVLACDASVHAWLDQLVPQSQTNWLSPVYTKDETSAIQKQIFTYARDVTDGTGKAIGSLIVNVDERMVFFRCLQSSELSGQGDSYIVKDGQIVSASNLNALNKILDIPASGSMVADVSMAMTDYHMVSIADADVITGDVRSTRNWILLAALLLNLLCCIPVFWIVHRMMQPMEQLEDTMQQVSQGDLKARATIYQQDEIGRLSQGFNDMVKQIEELIEELVTERMLKKEAEIEALQYQITPHFMYNTLNSIKYAAILQHSSEIAELLEAFIELLQLSASDRGAFIPIQQEIHMVQNYVKLQQFRYADSFTVSFDIQRETDGCYVPRLLIQPLVENAILHGLNHRDRKSHITISTMINGSYLAIKVVDDGEGMSPEALQMLMRGTQRNKFSGIGVSNIRERLKLYYAEQGKLSFFSEQGSGTTALLMLPASYDPDEYTI